MKSCIEGTLIVGGALISGAAIPLILLVALPVPLNAIAFLVYIILGICLCCVGKNSDNHVSKSKPIGNHYYDYECHDWIERK